MIGSRRQARKQQTGKILKNALVDLILENNNVQEITVSEIADRADLNRGTFYIHYKDKHEIIEDLFTDALEGIRQALRDPYKNVDRVILDGIVPSTKLLFEHIENHRNLFKALDLIQKIPDLYDRLEYEIRKILFEDIQLQLEQDPSEVEYEIYASYVVHATLGVIKYWIQSNFKYSTNFMCEQLTLIYSHRISALIIKRGE
ncbi:TetR/AcrR family transcriptional regulator [Cohnella sp. AR92]|uniref:TetR/AcrR family transcriptional regulator n=1 Tax=Cohnella sp. AR92 TaxID=648716 RepID=UPI00131577AE|nr:TetR/AcrR family transcriptional regulator [Cohnella sp. AR92]